MLEQTCSLDIAVHFTGCSLTLVDSTLSSEFTVEMAPGVLGRSHPAVLISSYGSELTVLPMLLLYACVL